MVMTGGWLVYGILLPTWHTQKLFKLPSHLQKPKFHDAFNTISDNQWLTTYGQPGSKGSHPSVNKRDFLISWFRKNGWIGGEYINIFLKNIKIWEKLQATAAIRTTLVHHQISSKNRCFHPGDQVPPIESAGYNNGRDCRNQPPLRFDLLTSKRCCRNGVTLW